ncbi:NUMOD4 domain-containing protein [Phenylobacterium koreense]|uniref:HNH nuclease domain-containing protein n=1 Tax=Phenylobacterium koreense TaxID=266125 RepID=A0ABV2EJN4_9CAUL
MTPHPEQWRPVVGQEGKYEVSDLGRVRSLDRVIIRSDGRSYRATGRLLKLQTRDARYFSVTIGGRSIRVHELVAAAFLGPRPAGKQVLHSDDDGHHNYLDNLRYGAASENRSDACLNAVAEDCLVRKDGRLRPSDVAAIKALLPEMGSRALARAWGVSRGAIDGIRRGRNWRAIAALDVHFVPAQLDLLRRELVYGPIPPDDPDQFWNANRELTRRLESA